MNILVTGAAGFIGAALVGRLLKDGNTVTGIDNINTYYDPELKLARLRSLGIGREAEEWDRPVTDNQTGRFTFIRLNLEEEEKVDRLFSDNKFEVVINLAAQAGVRYSIENPRSYVKSNVMGFINVLEGCRHSGVKHLIYASSSSVYGLNSKVPFSEHDSIAHPVSIYAATKKSDELMAHVYSYLYNLPTTGLRFFTVYGPWGRPDMSPFLFMDAILRDKSIKVFNNGDMWRDFTYIDDVVEGIVRTIRFAPVSSPVWDKNAPDPASSSAPYRVFNIGHQSPVNLLDYISCIEKTIGKSVDKQLMPMQPGDVYRTWADSSDLAALTGFCPEVDLNDGIVETVKWFREYYNL
ncbi:MAG: NAD-dependent epimerase [Muribaculaceae bacterium]|nr:NAD-dependent epimerase [Muribaculaceae bacterium]